MSTRHLVDPALLPGLDLMPALDLSVEGLPATRAAFDAGTDAQPVPEGIGTTVREEVIAGGDGQPLKLLVYIPPSAAGALAAVLHIHGGGYVLGSARMSDIANRYLARAIGGVIVSVDYRLAPETPHPGPVEDCYAALKWLHAEAAVLGVDPARIAIKGESAGGGLAAALALLARDRGGPAIRHQHLIYPMIDDRTGSTVEPSPQTGEFVWTPEANRIGWRALLGGAPGGADTPPHAAAARATNLGNLPPAFIATGALDLFVEEDMDYARRLMRAGVPTELHVYPGAYHGFDINVGAPVVEAFQRDSTTALMRALG